MIVLISSPGRIISAAGPLGELVITAKLRDAWQAGQALEHVLLGFRKESSLMGRGKDGLDRGLLLRDEDEGWKAQAAAGYSGSSSVLGRTGGRRDGSQVGKGGEGELRLAESCDSRSFPRFGWEGGRAEKKNTHAGPTRGLSLSILACLFAVTPPSPSSR